MGTKGREIVKADIKEILDLLNKALADEWLAYYQYWIGSKIVVGPMRDLVASELEEHANEELEHAGMLVERIIQLGGTPILNPSEWHSKTNCGYEAPTDPFVVPILKQNIKGEQCAIDVYNKIVEKVKGKDPITLHIVYKIMADEVEHEEDLEAIMDDLEAMKKHFK
ncbi:MAG: ferritin-like domain-containing protein [Candidatus Odinarchaeota archaeon]